MYFYLGVVFRCKQIFIVWHQMSITQTGLFVCPLSKQYKYVTNHLHFYVTYYNIF